MELNELVDMMERTRKGVAPSLVRKQEQIKGIVKFIRAHQAQMDKTGHAMDINQVAEWFKGEYK